VRVRESFGVGHVVSVLRGEDTERIRQRQHDQLSTYALLKGCTKHEVREWVYQLVAQDFLAQTTDEYPVLRLGARSREVLRGTAEVRLRQPAVVKKEKVKSVRRIADDTGDYDGALFETLRKWRREEAQRRGVPPYVIFSDRTLRDVARVRPTTLLQLRGIYGIGDTKMAEYGEKLVSLLRPAT
jgi:ATP-dependent DNA helicase RecQ